MESLDNSCQFSACSALETSFIQEIITIKTLFLDSLFLSSGVVDRRGSFTLSRGAGEEVRWSILAGVLALLGRALGVDGLPREDGGLGEAAGLGEAVLPLGVAGDECRCLDKELGLEGKKILRVYTVYIRRVHHVGHIVLSDLDRNIQKLFPVET